MARLFDNAIPEYFALASGVVTDEPITMACWFYADEDAYLGLVELRNSAQDGFNLLLRGDQAGDYLWAYSIRAGVTESNAATTTGYSLNTWHHGCAVFAATADRRAYIDGGSKGTDTGSVSISSMDETNVGTRLTFTDRPFSGRIAEAAIWNVALTDGEVKTLAAGVCPLRVRPTNLKGYWPLPAVTGNAIDYSGNGNDLTDTGTVGIADHAPVGPMFSFDEHLGLFVPAAAAAAATPQTIVEITHTFA